MTTTRCSLLVFVLFSTFLTLAAQNSLPLSIRQPFAVLNESDNNALRKMDTSLAMSEGYAPINAPLKVQLGNIIARLSASPDVGKAEIAVPLAIARTFQANDDCLYGDFKGSMQLSDAAIEALQTHARDTGAVYTLALAYGIKAYDLENLFDLEAALLERDKGIEVFKRIGYTSNIITERLNKSKIYAALGDEKAGLKELADYDQRKLAYKVEEYFKLDISAMETRSAFITAKGNQEHLLGEADSAQLTYQKALVELQEAAKNLDKYKDLFSSPNEFRAVQFVVQLSIASLYTNIKIPNKADSILAYAARAEAWGVPRDISANLVKSFAWIVKRDFKEAKTTVQAVMHDLIDARTDTNNIFSTPSVNMQNITFVQLIPTAYFEKGLLLMAMYDSSKMQNRENLDYLKHAFLCYQNALAASDSIAISFSTDMTMQKVVKRFSQIYPSTILTASYLYEATHKEAYLDTMLRIAEQRKAFILRQAVYSRANRERYTGKTLELYKEEQQLKRDLIMAQNAFDGNSTSDFLQKRNAIHANYRQFKENLKQMPPNTEGGRYYAERFADSVPTVKDIQRDWLTTKKGEAPRVFLSYTFSPTHVIALLVTPTGAKPYLKAINQTTWDLLRRFNASIESEKTFPNAAAYELYATLLKEILLDVPQNAHLIISAEGPLLRLPFEALLTQTVGDDNKNYGEMPFLIKKHRVSYVPSLTTQMWLRTFHKAATPIKSKIGIVKGNYTQGKYIDIKSLLSTADSVTTYFKNAATVFDNDKKIFGAKESDNADLTDLFFAVHGEASAENTLDYALILRDSSATDAGKLTVAKINQMRFKKLNSAVFGACETQHGDLDLGEGVFSIARAFQSLGCKHIVCTLNNVKIGSTARLLDNFYFHFKNEEQSLSKALHQAKMDYLSAKTVRREDKHPHCWANMIYLGDD